MSNREELTRQAEKCLRQGRVEDAIALYQELADLTPVDWGIVKQLADLFERSGQREAASRQFCRWADHLAIEGFHSKAAALYKKVLKLEPSDEHALWRLGEVSLELKLRADARVAFQRVLELRQRRGDTPGLVVARERLAMLEAAAPAPVRSPLGSIPPLATSAVAPAVSIAETTLPGPLTLVAATPAAPPSTRVAAASAPPAEVVVPPADTPERRLARLRHEAEEADRLQRHDAQARWQAVLDADPQDVATRLRLVQRAMDGGDFEAADRLALPLDASETSALVLLVELAWRRGHPDAVGRLIAGRVHAGAAPGHVLAPVDALGVRLPDAARTAVAAAVAAWKAAGQPGHAVAALEQADRRGLLDLGSSLEWVEICVDAGVAGLSRAQAALARAYVAAGRTADARAVAEDLFVRETGAEPYRALLLDVLDRLGEANPHRVLVELLTPPSEGIDEPPVFPSSVTREVVDLDLDRVLTVPASALADVQGWPSLSLPADNVREPQAATQLQAAAGEGPLAMSPRADTRDSSASGLADLVVQDIVVSAAATVVDASRTPSSFDWAFLLGRDVEECWSSEVAVAMPVTRGMTRVPTGLVPSTDFDEGHGAPAPPAPSFTDRDSNEPAASEALVTEVEGVGAAAEEALLGPAAELLVDPPADLAQAATAAVAIEDPQGAPEHDSSEVRTPVDPVLAKIAAAQPVMAAPAEVLPPSFSVPLSWFADTPVEGAPPRQRHPQDAYLFEDDEQRPGGWLSRPTGDRLLADVQPDSAYAGPRRRALPEPVPADVEEEVDLTQLLEELRQFDTVLPDPPSRPLTAERLDADARVAAVPDLPASVSALAMTPSLSDLLVPAPPTPAEEPPRTRPPLRFAQDASTELDVVFADVQQRTDDRLVAEQQLAAGRVFLAAGLVAEAARAFERASQAPRSRFAAAQALAELHRSRAQLPDAVSWYEQAAAAPVPDAAAKRPVLYDLAESLEALGETDRAVGVLMDLLSQVEDYRDARARLGRLLRVDAGG